MIRAYILIETNGGIKVKYVNNTVNDTAGISQKYYSYRGNAYQELGLSIRGEYEGADTGLERGVTYYLQVNVDGEGATEYDITFPIIDKDVFEKPNQKYIISFSELYRALDKLSPDFQVRLINRDVRFISNGDTASTSMALTAGVSGTDLFASLNASIEAAATSDNYLDQSGSGTVKGDFDSISTSLVGAAGLLDFPDDGGSTTTLIRRNNNNDFEERTNIYTQIYKGNISKISVIEEAIPD